MLSLFKITLDCHFIKKRLQHRCFPINFLRTFLRTTVLKNICGQLLLVLLLSSSSYCALLVLKFPICDDTQINNKLYTFLNLFNQGTNFNLDSRNICKLFNVCVLFLLLLFQIICQIVC